MILLIEGNYHLHADKELIAHNGPSKIPSSFPYDSDMILKEATLPNGETFSRDGINLNMYHLISISVCLIYTAHYSSNICRNLCLVKLTRTNAGIIDYWRKLSMH